MNDEWTTPPSLIANEVRLGDILSSPQIPGCGIASPGLWRQSLCRRRASCNRTQPEQGESDLAQSTGFRWQSHGRA